MESEATIPSPLGGEGKGEGKIAIVGDAGLENQFYPDPVSRIAERMGNRKSREFFGLTFGVRPTNPWKRRMPKVGRNEPCPCGSGKKFKKCCLMG